MITENDLVREAAETWCAGSGKVCSYYNIRKQFLSALSEYMNKHSLSKEDILGISGIGCSGRFTTWQDVVTVHTTHGNAGNTAQGAATAMQLAKKKGLVYVVSGDGDALAIGMSNFQQLCHNNVKATYMILNNGIYAMTAGQTAPTTQQGIETVSAPYGNLETPWDTVSLAIESGATFVARASGYPKESKMLKDILLQSFEHNGTSVIEIMSYCPTQDPVSRKRKLAEAEKEYLKNSVDIKDLKSDLSPKLKYAVLKEELKKESKLIKGLIYCASEKGYAELLLEQKKKAQSAYPGENLKSRISSMLKDKKITSI
ncbi:hypothetical protein FJZ53_01190 [Candidatus Woesearchaeota archaeon]|nr:hypothetical protein [Candidatus Woesearchaeota archaeon]